MRFITKGLEPASLTQHRQRRYCCYSNYSGKDELRAALASEQLGLCCYCMSRIVPRADAMKVEHWRCQDHYPAEQLSYRNLLGACLGGQGQPEHLQHCDTRKGNQELAWNPAEPLHRIETRVRYEPEGKIASDDPAFDHQLNAVLNLNHELLRNNRKAVFDGVLGWWQSARARARGPVPTVQIERKRDEFAARSGTMPPFAPVAIWFLTVRLERRQSL